MRVRGNFDAVDINNAAVIDDLLQSKRGALRVAGEN